MTNKIAAKAESFLESNGFEFVRKNGKGLNIWRRGDILLPVTMAMRDFEYHDLVRDVSRQLGLTTAKSEKNSRGSASKQRRARRAQRAADQRRREDAARAERAAAADAEYAARRGEHLVAVAERRVEKQRIRDVAVQNRLDRNRDLGGLGAHLTNREAEQVTLRLEQQHDSLAVMQKLAAAVPLANTVRHRA